MSRGIVFSVLSSVFLPVFENSTLSGLSRPFSLKKAQAKGRKMPSLSLVLSSSSPLLFSLSVWTMSTDKASFLVILCFPFSYLSEPLLITSK